MDNAALIAKIDRTLSNWNEADAIWCLVRAHDVLGAALAAQPPRELTEAMIVAAGNVSVSKWEWGKYIRTVWRAMYDAAPQPAAAPNYHFDLAEQRDAASAPQQAAQPCALCGQWGKPIPAAATDDLGPRCWYPAQQVTPWERARYQMDREIRAQAFAECAALCDWEAESGPSNHTGAARCAKNIRARIAVEDGASVAEGYPSTAHSDAAKAKP